MSITAQSQRNGDEWDADGGGRRMQVVPECVRGSPAVRHVPSLSLSLSLSLGDVESIKNGCEEDGCPRVGSLI